MLAAASTPPNEAAGDSHLSQCRLFLDYRRRPVVEIRVRDDPTGGRAALSPALVRTPRRGALGFPGNRSLQSCGRTAASCPVSRHNKCPQRTAGVTDDAGLECTDSLTPLARKW